MDELQVSSEQLLHEIGRLHVANAVLTAQLDASRKEVLRLNAAIAQNVDGPTDDE